MTTRRRMNWIDISVPLYNGMVHWPNDPAFKLVKFKTFAKGNSVNLSRISLCSHAGTHMDAPYHFVRNGKTLDQMPLDATIGPARVIEIKDPAAIGVEELRKHKLKHGERILLKTTNSQRCWKSNKFMKNFVHISPEAAAYLSTFKLRCLGVDYLSVGGYFENGALIHSRLLKSGVWIIEGLDLSKISAGKYFLICLPLNVKGAEGAPARAVLGVNT